MNPSMHSNILSNMLAWLTDNAEGLALGALIAAGLVGLMLILREVGHRLLESLEGAARKLEIGRLFCLTFEVDFFARRGFSPIGEQVVDPDVYSQLIRSPDEGVAEFLDLAHVKPNTLGNTRMLLHLGA